jgi:hypothetical protein
MYFKGIDWIQPNFIDFLDRMFEISHVFMFAMPLAQVKLSFSPSKCAIVVFHCTLAPNKMILPMVHG